MLEKLPHAIGRALKDNRPGLEATLHCTAAPDAPELITVTSPAFFHGEAMGKEFTEDGAKQSPPLKWTGVTIEAPAVLLVAEDADSPTGKPLVHLIVYEEPGRDGDVPAGAFSGKAAEHSDDTVGKNSFRKTGWLPPDPPPGHGAHRYVFQVFQLKHTVEFKHAPTKKDVEKALEDNVMAKGVLIGTYERK